MLLYRREYSPTREQHNTSTFASTTFFFRSCQGCFIQTPNRASLHSCSSTCSTRVNALSAHWVHKVFNDRHRWPRGTIDRDVWEVSALSTQTLYFIIALLSFTDSIEYPNLWSFIELHQTFPNQWICILIQQRQQDNIYYFKAECS